MGTEIFVNQRTLDWHRARLGVFTASEIGNLRGKPKSANAPLPFTETALAYIYEKLGERLLDPAMVADDERFGEYLDRTNVETRAMRYGTEHEPDAVAAYARATGAEVLAGGFCTAPDMPYIVASPDGRVGEEGLVETKCPSTAKFGLYVGTVASPADLLAKNAMYYWQCQCQLFCTGRVWCDWCAYSEDCGGRVHIVRVERDKALIAEMTDKAKLAHDLIEAKVAAFNRPF